MGRMGHEAGRLVYMGRIGHEAGIHGKHKRVCNECSPISVYFGTPTQSALTSPVIMNIALFSESSVSPRGGGVGRGGVRPREN